MLERPSAKPIENLRPQHLIDAIFWDAIPADAPVLLEEAREEASRYYVLTVVRHADERSAERRRIGRLREGSGSIAPI